MSDTLPTGYFEGNEDRAESGQNFVIRRGDAYVSRITSEDKGWRTGGLRWVSDPSRALIFNGNLKSAWFDNGRVHGTVYGWLQADDYASDVHNARIRRPSTEVLTLEAAGLAVMPAMQREAA